MDSPIRYFFAYYPACIDVDKLTFDEALCNMSAFSIW